MQKRVAHVVLVTVEVKLLVGELVDLLDRQVVLVVLNVLLELVNEQRSLFELLFLTKVYKDTTYL